MYRRVLHLFGSGLHRWKALAARRLNLVYTFGAIKIAKVVNEKPENQGISNQFLNMISACSAKCTRDSNSQQRPELSDGAIRFQKGAKLSETEFLLFFAI